MNNDDIKLNIKGNVNVLNKKINFDNLELNNDYKATKEDLKYYKSNFEKFYLIKILFKYLIYQK